MRYCRTCILPDTRPNLTINENGDCNCFVANKRIQIDWSSREQSFREVVANAKKLGRTYDCVIPVSGGKDSTWQVIKALEYGLHPLCVTWRTPARSPLGQKNLDNLISLGVDHIDLSINPTVERLFTLKSFKKFGSPVIPMHMAIHALPVQIALEKNIPLILWGENSAVEYGGDDESLKGEEITRDWLMKYGVTHGTTSADWVDDELSDSDMAPYAWPEEDEIKESKLKAVFLGQYFKWDPTLTAHVARQHGFEAASQPVVGYFNFADVDDAFLMCIHHWMKWYKFGFTRTWDNLSIEIRAGRLKRSEAIEIVEQIGNETPINEISEFCKFVQISTDEFFAIAETFRNKKIWKKRSGVWKVDGFLIENWKWEDAG